jgi:PAS domain S-box-containing protein
MLERAPTACMAFDHEWRVLYMNAEGERLVQRTASELLGRTMAEAFPAAVGSVFDDAYRRAAATKTLVYAEDYFAPLDRWMEVAAYPIALGLAVHFTDVTARHRQTEQLARRERELARAQQIATVGSWLWHIADNRVEWSDETYRILGFSADFRPTTTDMAEFIDAHDVERNWIALRATLDHDVPYDIVLRMRHASGDERICHARAEVVRAADGTAQQLFGTLQDISARVRLERRAEQDRRDLDVALRVAKMANYSWDGRSPTITWSRGYYEMLGLDPATFVPVREEVLALVHPDDIGRLRAESEAAFATGDAMEIQYRMRHADGSWRHIASTARIERDRDGQLLRLVGSVRDRTDEVRMTEERVRLERKLLQTQKLESLGVLAGGIAHDFNNLLVGILGNASLAMLSLHDETAPASAVREPLAEIERAAQRAAELTQQMLAYAGRGQFVIGAVNLTQLVDEMLSLLRSALSRKAELRLDLARTLPLINGDATQLRQIVMNLLTNASDALADGPGVIELRTAVVTVTAASRVESESGELLPSGEYVTLTVSDTGMGMDAETRARIFDPFFTTKFTGRGLGLAAARGIVEGHRGAIRLDSSVGRGTAFTVYLPVADVSAVGRATAIAQTPWRGSGTVLVIDDEPAVRRVLQTLFRRRGFSVLEAEDGEAGLALFARERATIQLTLLDLTMPRMDGAETFRRLRQLDPTARIVLMSGYNTQNITALFGDSAPDGFVQKPFRVHDLEMAARAVLDR